MIYDTDSSSDSTDFQFAELGVNGKPKVELGACTMKKPREDQLNFLDERGELKERKFLPIPLKLYMLTEKKAPGELDRMGLVPNPNG